MIGCGTFGPPLVIEKKDHDYREGMFDWRREFNSHNSISFSEVMKDIEKWVVLEGLYEQRKIYGAEYID